MIKSLSFDLYPRYSIRPIQGRLLPGVRYRLAHADQISWRHPHFWMAEQTYNGKHAYAMLVEVQTDIRLALSAKASREDLFWLYKLEGTLRITPNPNGSEPPTRHLCLRQGQYAPLFAGRGDYMVTLRPGRHQFLLVIAQLSWMKRYVDTSFAPIRHLLQGQDAGFLYGVPQAIRIPHLRCLSHLREIAHSPSFRQDVTVYDHLADLFDLYLAEIGPVDRGEAPIGSVEENVAEISRYLQREVIKGNVPTLTTLAEAFELKEKTLTRHFKRVHRLTPVQYIQRIRMAEAERLLSQEGLPPTLVAYQLGYDHLRTFERAFKRYRGETPRDVRRPAK